MIFRVRGKHLCIFHFLKNMVYKNLQPLIKAETRNSWFFIFGNPIIFIIFAVVSKGIDGFETFSFYVFGSYQRQIPKDIFKTMKKVILGWHGVLKKIEY